MKNYNPHYIQEKIDAYRSGKLSEEEVDLLWAELIEDPDQLEYLINSVNLEAIASDKDIAQFTSGAQMKPTSSKRFRFYRLSGRTMRIAAVFLVLTGILSMIYLFGSDYVFEPEPIAVIELDSYRSSTIPTAVFDYQIQRAINYASLEQYDLALENIQEINPEYLSEEQKISLAINKGSIYYNRGNYAAAKNIFQEILDRSEEEMHVLTKEKIHWFLGNTYLHLEEEDLAMIHIQKTYELNGAYRRLAKRYLN